MRPYKITEDAEADLLKIWQYTAKTWGRAQADNYFHQIEDCFNKIAAGKARSRQPLAAHKKLKSVRYEHHYVFFLAESEPVIMAILHEKMNFIARLEKRLKAR